MPADESFSTPSSRPPPAPGRVGARRRSRNRAWVAVLLLAMGLLVAYCGWFVGGWVGVVWAILAGVVALGMVRRLPVDALLNAMNVTPLEGDMPTLDQAIAILCARADLLPPRLYRIDEELPLAFSVADAKAAAIVVSDGLLRGLNLDELCGILAHEIVHLRHGDLRLLQIGLVSRVLTRLLSRLGFLIVLLGLLLNVLSLARFALMSLIVLAAAPVAVSLLALTVSRAREAEADLEAAELTGDPAALASALAKLRRRQEWRLRQMFPTGRALHLPTLLSDHPPTAERIRRLREMVQ